ncbi:hypothetical protein [Methylobacterium sp. J-090]|uniref:hypothetical protein n=1 Tax=Methylobacterium sp. J-090 TaxID=2836666 RepID=UPI001FBA9657|nr:hypothetical protein [Methylobacterium sp. J-090]MCJ2081233.1 hypothetical protein [Methylobacterium sp. J-090]
MVVTFEGIWLVFGATIYHPNGWGIERAGFNIIPAASGLLFPEVLKRLNSGQTEIKSYSSLVLFDIGEIGTLG